jgi:hypothetical protein
MTLVAVYAIVVAAVSLVLLGCGWTVWRAPRADVRARAAQPPTVRGEPDRQPVTPCGREWKREVADSTTALGKEGPR